MRNTVALFVLTAAAAGACRSSSPQQTFDAPASADAPRPIDGAIDGATAIDGSGAIDPSAEIAAARAAADGSAALPIDGALITYIAPLIGSDAQGVFVQAAKAGPALFVAVDPSTLSPAPMVGDTVSFTITDMTTVAMERRADAVANWSRSAQGTSVAPLVQDLSAATDLVTGVAGYDSDLVTVTGTVSSAFTPSATGHVAAELDTSAITGNASLKVRLPSDVNAVADLAPACVITIGPTPLAQFNASPEVTAWVASDVHVTSCPAPKVVSAVATAATTVVVTFDRLLSTGSVTADGSQFTFDQGLTATAATVAGDQVTLTTASELAVTYTLTVANTVTDTYSSGVDGTAATAQFVGFQPFAQVLINEVNPNITGSHDLVELLVTAGGTLNGITLVQDVANPTTLATLPNLVVATGDLVVVHLTPVTSTTETTTKADCTDAACFAGAWDVNGGAAGITFSNRTLRLIAPDGTTVLDALAVAKASSTSPAGFPADLQALQTAGVWQPPNCGGAACTYTSTPIASDPTIAIDWSKTGTTAAGNSISRKNGAATQSAADWSSGTSSFGAANP